MSDYRQDDNTDSEEDFPEGMQPAYHRGKIFLAGFTVFILLIVLVSMFACGPRQGTILYGICKAYLEQIVAYPETIIPSNVEQYPSATRVYFTSVDPFGQFKLQQIECVYAQDESGNLLVDKVLFDRREEPAERVKLFNESLSAIVAAEPDLTLPPPMMDIDELLENLKD